MNRLRSLFRRFFPRPTYAVIYDHGPEDSPTEEYYGYFSSVHEAERMYEQLAHGQGYYNAHVVRLVKPLSSPLTDLD